MKAKREMAIQGHRMHVIKRDQKRVTFEIDKIKASLIRIAKQYPELAMHDIAVDSFVDEVRNNVYEGITTQDLEKVLIFAAVAFIEKDPSYNLLAAGFFLQRIHKEVLQRTVTPDMSHEAYKESFFAMIKTGLDQQILDKRMQQFDLDYLSSHLVPDRDRLLRYTGLQTLYERYFLRDNGRVIELPQVFWMRVAMGLSLNETDFNERAVDFYQIFSLLRYVPSTPTLFHAATVRPQLSSCYLTYIDDDLDHIFKCLKDNANLAKWSGGIGNDWTSLRATGSMIRSLKMRSQGLVPFLKIANDVVAAINRSGSRRGATCAYLEAWHLDFEDFLDLRRNTGDERRRTHDMNTANWIPDLFMKRVLADQEWTFFSPLDTPDLHDLYGKKFEAAYEHYEEQTRRGELKNFKRIPAKDLWRKMLTRLFETGHPWLTFKDACNIRSPQDHVGVIHSSNLCTEITLNTSRTETAVCNIGSINLSEHVIDGKLDTHLLAQTIKTAIRLLDNVIDVNFYPTSEAENSNLRHRPIGLGIMGLQDALFKLDIPFDDDRSLKFSDVLMETISYHAIFASSELARERGAYASYKGSKWDRGIFPIDTLDLLEQERQIPIEVSRTSCLDWHVVRENVKHYGMRNSNVMAIAPTATISNIAGCYPSIEPPYKNLYVKSNMSGEFTVVNEYLVNDLKTLNLWNDEMLNMIKYYDGSIQMIEIIPDHLRRKYKEAFEIDQIELIKRTAVRGKWIDQSQSHNVFMNGVSGKKLSDVYMFAWKAGVKTMYYLRSMGASQIEKSTLDAKQFGFTQKRVYEKLESVSKLDNACSNEILQEQKACSLEAQHCESCQ